MTIGYEEPRSGRKHKAWGASPRIKIKKAIEPAKRATAFRMDALSPASRAQSCFLIQILGLAPQALCCRPLRGLDQHDRVPDGVYKMMELNGLEP